MYVSGWSFLIFVVVLIFLSVLFVDSLVPVVSWTLLWSIYVYASNLWSNNKESLSPTSINVRNVAAQQERRAQRGLVATRLPQNTDGNQNIYDTVS